MKGSLLVAGIDPGGTTGFCILQAPMTLIQADEGADRAKILAWVISNMPHRLVVEDFRVYPGMVSSIGWNNLPAPRVIATLEDACVREGIPLIKQQPSCKSRITDDILKKAGLWQTGKPHANDAIRHALYYLWFKEGCVDDPKVSKLLIDIANQSKMGKYTQDAKYLKDVRKLSVLSSMFFGETVALESIKLEDMGFISFQSHNSTYHIYNDCPASEGLRTIPVYLKWLVGDWELCTECKNIEISRRIVNG